VGVSRSMRKLDTMRTALDGVGEQDSAKAERLGGGTWARRKWRIVRAARTMREAWTTSRAMASNAARELERLSSSPPLRVVMRVRVRERWTDAEQLRLLADVHLVEARQ
jgi:hypothetical protein